MKSRKAKKILLAAGMSGLCLAVQAPYINLESYAAESDMWPPEKGELGDSIIGIEEYGRGTDWTGWLTVTIRVLMPDEKTPAKDVFITMNPKGSNEQAGHGPNINGTTEYKTDENGELMFRIYPSPVEYMVRVPAGSEWIAKSYDIGSVTQDNTTITIVLEKETKPSEPETKPSEPETKPSEPETKPGTPETKPGHNSGGGSGGSSGGNKGNGGNDQNNGPGVTKPDQNNNPSKPSEKPNQPQKPSDASKPGTDDQPSNPSGPHKPADSTTPGTERNEDYVVPGKDLEPGTKDDVTVTPGKDENGKNNSSMDKDGRVNLPDGGSIIRPTEPNKGDIRIDVPGGTVINPDGSIELPEQDQETTITIPGKDQTLDTEDDVKVTPGLDTDGKNNSMMDDAGNITLPDGGRVDYPSIPDQGEIKVDVPEGTVISPDGTLQIPDGTWNRYTLPGKDSQIDTSDDVQVVPELGKNGRDNALLRADGSLYLPDGGTVTYADGTTVEVPEGTVVLPDGTIVYPDGTTSDETAEAATLPAATGRLRFADCSFHWLELLALLSVILIAMKRLYYVKHMNEELDQLLEEHKEESETGKEE